eukprot:4918507-Prorocentrum_lima.AAC.1
MSDRPIATEKAPSSSRYLSIRSGSSLNMPSTPGLQCVTPQGQCSFVSRWSTNTRLGKRAPPQVLRETREERP